MHGIAIMALASGGHGQRKIVFGVLLLIIIALVVGWVMYAKKARGRS
jgi:hypothetical protein